jgi:hypothetical protein
MTTPLERLARRVESDPFFLAAPLARFAESERLDDEALAVRLGCDQDTLTRLRLCRNPEPEPPQFAADVERIAARFGLDADRLAEAVRRGQTVLRFRAAGTGGTGSLLAARDGAEENPS